MITVMIQCHDGADRLAVQQAVAFVRQLRQLAAATPAGAILPGRARLLEDGYWGVTAWVGELSGQVPPGGDGAALREAVNYFAGHRERLGYALRLRRGRTIGSGLVEGCIKQPLNRRLKRTGARWKAAQVGPFVQLGALATSPDWDAFWKHN